MAEVLESFQGQVVGVTAIFHQDAADKPVPTGEQYPLPTKRAFVIKQTTIPAGQSISGEVSTDGLTLVGVVMPSAWNAAEIRVSGATQTGGTYYPLMDRIMGESFFGGIPAPSTFVAFERDNDTACLPFLKIRSGLTSAPIVQSADRVLTLVFKG
jgi:hypothetical protein